MGFWFFRADGWRGPNASPGAHGTPPPRSPTPAGWRGRIGPWGRHQCSPVPLCAASCKAGSVTPRHSSGSSVSSKQRVGGSIPPRGASQSAAEPGGWGGNDGDPPPRPPRFDSQLTTARSNRRFPGKIAFAAGITRFYLTESILIGHSKNSADMGRPLSTPRSHVEEAGGTRRDRFDDESL